MRKIISIILIILTIVSIISIPTKSNANISISSADLYSADYFENLLRWNGIGLICNMVVYNKDGVEYPAYCLNREIDGVTDSSPYSVNTDNLLQNVMVWRTIINGYPYKTCAELGCNNRQEAYFATKQAVYCALYSRDPNSYSSIGEGGERTLNALKQIVSSARNSTETKISSELTINSESSIWQQDKMDNKYVSKTFSVSAKAGITSYSISINGDVIEGSKITSENNEEKANFNYGQKFKILIPIANTTKNGTFNINVNGEVATKPVLYGESGSSVLQDYALTANMYEEGKGERQEAYTKNETKIIILKQKSDTKEPMKGIQFQLLDKDNNVIYTELETNEEGKIIIENLLPGTYYIKETKTLLGYKLYEQPIETKLQINEEANIFINNQKEEIKINTEKTSKEQQIEVKAEKKLPKTGI